MSAHTLALCKQLYQAALTCKEQCERLVPSAFNAALLEALQCVMLSAVQLQEEEQLRAVRSCLESACQLLSRVGSLGSIEAFFSADELLVHYQSRVDAAHALLCKLGGGAPTPACCAAGQHQQPAAASGAGAAAKRQQPQQQAHAGGATQGCSRCRLQLPEQQQQVVQSFRRQAAKLCPLLVQSCPQADLQQLCDTVKQGLVLVNGHSFLIGQDWQAEVTAMLLRAEQLKVLLAHWQAHHLSLLASVLLHIHQQEVQEYDTPRPNSSSPSRRPGSASASQGGRLLAGELQQQQAAGPGMLLVAGLQLLQQEQQHGLAQAAAAAALQTEFHSVCLEDEAGLSDDEFFLPVAPLRCAAAGSPNGSPESAAAGLPSLPFHIPAARHGGGSGSMQSDGDSLARTPSSGCSSLLEYVHSSMGPAKARGSSAHDPAESPGSSPPAACPASIEQQLLGIAGSPEVAAVLASALGFEQVSCSRSSSVCGSASSIGGGGSIAGTTGSSGPGALLPFRDSGCQSGKSSPVQSRAGSVIGRLSSSAAKALAEGLASSQRSSPGTARQHQAQQQQQQQQQQQRATRRWRRPAKQSSTLLLQGVQLPPACCRSIGAVCYLCPHLKRVALVGVGLTDLDVGYLVDALKVNSSVQHLDLSHNGLEDIGARVLAKLLHPSAGCSSRLRTLCLQHNRIGDDGVAALAAGLTSSSSLQRLWLQHNAVSEAGAKALCRAMHTNTACTDIKLHPGNEGVPAQLAQAVVQLARQNRGARDHIKGLLRMMHLSSS